MTSISSIVIACVSLLSTLAVVADSSSRATSVEHRTGRLRIQLTERGPRSTSDPTACVSYVPQSLVVAQIKGGEWQLKSTTVVLHTFWNESDATKALEIAKHYRQRCSVGDRNTWNFEEIWLPAALSFTTSFPEACSVHDLTTVRVEEEDGWWSVLSKNRPDDQYFGGLGRFKDEASARVVERWGKEHSTHCDIGRDAPVDKRPGHIMKYWRK